ncbi:hypothetical protein KXW60_005197 [Aspergillus fumigatus]|nr:hypothetical protein KXW60_005197 [Aspergillus fumigatus]KAH3267541.1 hypothetical protein KXW55_005288 [Aspergillus fumigatus]
MSVRRCWDLRKPRNTYIPTVSRALSSVHHQQLIRCHHTYNFVLLQLLNHTIPRDTIAENDASPVSADVIDNSYVGETRSELRNQVPVQPDQDDYEDPMQPPYSNTDQQLAADEREAIDKSNILRGDRLRHAKPQTANKYNEGPDEDDLPDVVRYGDSGVSSTKRLS